MGLVIGGCGENTKYVQWKSPFPNDMLLF